MYRKKRYLLPDANTTYDIPLSTKYYRRKNRNLCLSETYDIECTLEDQDDIASIDHDVNQPGSSFADDENGTFEFDIDLSTDTILKNSQEFEALLLYEMIRHSWTKETIKTIFMIINHLPLNSNYKLISASSFLKKYCNGHNSAKTVYICPSCKRTIESDISVNPMANDHGGSLKYTCSECDRQYSDTFLKDSQSYFLTFDLSEQLKEFLQNEDVEKMRLLPNQTEKLATIVDGQKYKSIQQTLCLTDFDFTFTLNFDGIPLYNSSKSSLWPVLLCINELRGNFRETYIYVAGFWIGEKPDPNVYVLEVVKNLKSLEKGIIWYHPKKKLNITSRFFVILCSADAPARAAIQNRAQFNGRYGCGSCFEQGTVVRKGKGHTRVYPNVEEIEGRSHDEELRLAKIANENETPVFGIFGLNPLYLLKGFDMVESFVFDYMHTLLLGVARSLVSKIWLNHEHRGKPWYLGKVFNLLGNRMRHQTPPSEVQRCARHLNEMHYFKASEWLNIVLYYGYGVFEDTLPSEYYNHWILLVNICHISSQESISNGDIETLRDMCKKFVLGIKELYGVSHCSYNLHQLLHLADCVTRWSPVHNYNCFHFETVLGRLKSSLKSSHKPMEQLRNLLYKMSMSYRANQSVSTVTSLTGCNVKSNNFITLKNEVSRITLLADVSYFHDDSDSIRYFYKFILKGIVFSSTHLQNGKKRQDCYFIDKGECIHRFKYLRLQNGKIEVCTDKIHSQMLVNAPGFLCKDTNSREFISIENVNKKLFFVRRKMYKKCFYLFTIPH